MELRRECLLDALLGGVVVLDGVGDRSEFGELCEAKCSRYGLTVAGHDDFAVFDLGEEVGDGVWPAHGKASRPVHRWAGLL
jgi:hypothetical protein